MRSITIRTRRIWLHAYMSTSLMNLLDDRGFSRRVRNPSESPIGKGELIVRLGIARRQVRRAFQMFDGSCRLPLLNQRASKCDTRFVRIGIERNRSLKFAHTFGGVLTPSFDQ